jgi:hypothetical protein
VVGKEKQAKVDYLDGHDKAVFDLFALYTKLPEALKTWEERASNGHI